MSGISRPGAVVTSVVRSRAGALLRDILGRDHGGGARGHVADDRVVAAQRTLATAGAIVLLAGTAWGAGTGDRSQKPGTLAIKLSATVSRARHEVTVRARVEPDERSRALVIEWLSDDLVGGSHLIELEGDRAAPSHHFTLKHLTPGRYVVTAILRRNDGTEARRRSELVVVEMGQSIQGVSIATEGPAGDLVRPTAQP